MTNGLHTHYYDGITSIADRHDHRYFGRTSPEPDTPGHTHIMEGRTTTDDGHNHYYRLQTGQAIRERGGHYHCYRGETDVADRHIHRMEGCTSVDS